MKRFISVSLLMFALGCNKSPDRPGFAAGSNSYSNSFGNEDGSSADASPDSVPEVTDSWQNPSSSQATSLNFDLSEFISITPELAEFQQITSIDGSTMSFGTDERFKTDANIKIKAGEDLDGISAQFISDIVLFGAKISDAGVPIDMGVEVTADKAEAYIRYFGEDKFKGALEGAFEQTFVREIEYKDRKYQSSPDSEIKLDGKAGGEIGLRAESAFRAAGGMHLLFAPRIAMTVKAEGNVGLGFLLDGDASGTARLLDFDMSTSTIYGKVGDYSYGTVDLSSALINALDGDLEIIVKPIVGPSLIGGTLTKKGFTNLEEKLWVHKISSDESAIQVEMPAIDTDFMGFLQQPSSQSECQSQQGAISQALQKSFSQLSDYSSLSDADLQASAASLDRIAALEERMNSYCR